MVLKFNVLFNCFQFSLAFLLVGFILSVKSQEPDMPGPIPDPDDSSSLDGFFENDDMVNGEQSGKHILYDVRCLDL